MTAREHYMNEKWDSPGEGRMQKWARQRYLPALMSSRDRRELAAEIEHFDPLAPLITQDTELMRQSEAQSDHDALRGRYNATHLNPPEPAEMRAAEKPAHLHGPWYGR